MSPQHLRAIFIAFGLLTLGVAGNALLLQPAPQMAESSRAAAEAALQKAEAERRQRLALDRLPLAAQPLAIAIDAAKPGATAAAPPRATASAAVSGGPRVIAIAQQMTVMPTSAVQQMEEGARRFARLKPNAAALRDRPRDTLPDAPGAEGDPATIKAVQRELTARGYGPLVADGVPGLVTRAAIMAFEHDSKMPLTGEATERILARLLLGPTGTEADSADPAAGRVRSAEAEIVMRTVQQSLTALGYQVGRIDGRSGDGTERAIREFEIDEGLKPTGRVSAEVFGRLGRVVATAKPQVAR